MCTCWMVESLKAPRKNVRLLNYHHHHHQLLICYKKYTLLYFSFLLGILLTVKHYDLWITTKYFFRFCLWNFVCLSDFCFLNSNDPKIYFVLYNYLPIVCYITYWYLLSNFLACAYHPPSWIIIISAVVAVILFVILFWFILYDESAFVM